MKKIVLLLIVTVFFSPLVKTQTPTAPAGSGTQGDPYLIASVNNLAWLHDWFARYTGNDFHKYYLQTANINASSTSGWASGAGFDPVGWSSDIFTGTYDGNGYSIDSLFISRTGEDKVGFFGYFSGTVRNLHLTNLNITGYTNVGGLVGYSGNGSITNCSTTGSMGSGAQYVGGLVGQAINSSIDSCYSTVSFSSMSGSIVGGFIGYSQNTPITNSYSTGSISGSSGGTRIGGFVGENTGGSGGNISKCYSTVNVTESSGSSNYVGGFAGRNSSGGTISKSFATGNVQAYGYVGGFVGDNLASSVIRNSYSRGNVVSNSGSVVGGFAGYNEGTNGTIDTCYSTGSVSGGSNMGGFIGVNGGFVNSSFWDTETSGLLTSAAGTGKTTTQMKTPSTFSDAGWSLSMWYLDGGINDDYPYLEWQNPGGSPLPVELISFEAAAKEMNVELNWKTASEVNNARWEVQKSEVRGQKSDKNWVKVGLVKGSGTTNTQKSYSFVDVSARGKVAYRLKQIDNDGKFKYSQEVVVEVGGAPKVFALEQNYPNPFNPSTTIGFTLQVSGFTTLKIYDAIGKEVATLVNENLEAGVYHQKTFNASNLTSGIYFARLKSGSNVQLKKMMLLK